MFKQLQKIGKARDEDIQGVPYIIVGNKSWSGYSSEYDDEIVMSTEEIIEIKNNCLYLKDLAYGYMLVLYFLLFYCLKTIIVL